MYEQINNFINHDPHLFLSLISKFFFYYFFLYHNEEKFIHCCKNYTLCVNEGYVYYFGYLGYGVHYRNQEENEFPPKMIPILKNIKSVAGESDHNVY